MEKPQLLLTALAGLGLLAGSARAAVIASDNFNYSDGNLAGKNGGVGWSAAWTNVQGTATALGGQARINSTAGQQVGRVLAAPQSKAGGSTIWARFSAQQVSTASGSTTTYGGVGFFNGATERSLIGKSWPGNYVWGVGVAGTFNYSVHSTLMPVTNYVRIIFNPTGDDTMDVWINPGDATALTNQTPTITRMVPDLSFDRVLLRGGISGPMTESWSFDDLALGTTLGDVAIVSTNQAPVINSPPLGGVAPVGGAFTFQVSSSGTAPLAYRWQHAATNLPGAAASSLTLSNLSLAEGGEYRVVITNNYGAVTSSVATLIISTNPALLAYESFSAYPAGALPGQPAQGMGFQAGSSWTGLNNSFTSLVSDASTVVPTGGLSLWTVQSTGGLATVKGDSSNTRLFMDTASNSVFAAAGLLDTNSNTIGGGNVNGTLYVSFLFQALSGDRNNEFGGLQLSRSDSTGTGVLLGNGQQPWAYGFVIPPNNPAFVDLLNYGGVGSFLTMDNAPHLMVAKIAYAPGADDTITVWTDPLPISGEGNQNFSGTYMGSGNGDCSFDRLFLRGGSATHQFNIDEIRFGSTWDSVLSPGPPLPQMSNDLFQVKFNLNGSIRSMLILRSNAWESVPFRADGYAGPAWRIWDGAGPRSIPLTLTDTNNMIFTGQDGLREVALQYHFAANQLVMTASITNTDSSAWSPTRAGILMGLDTYMAAYPAWDYQYFPTMLRCERTHFWGYAMTPFGRILGMASPDPVASWHNEYEPGQHRIYTFGLDLLNELPLPARHPQDLTTLQPGEGMSWTISLVDVVNDDPVGMDAVLPALAAQAEAPVIKASRYTGEPGDEVTFTFWGSPVGATLQTPDGAVQSLPLSPGGGGALVANFTLPATNGLCTVVASNAAGRVAEASVNIRPPWSWYLKQARVNALNKPQKDAGAQCEGYYGFYSMFLAQRWFPDASLDAQSEAKFNELFPLMFSTNTGLATFNSGRIQNSATMAGILADRYLTDTNLTNLNWATALCDFLLSRQGGNGAYLSGNADYTSVIYPGKSIMEVMAIEEQLGQTNAYWHSQYTNHFASVGRAMDYLAENLDNIGTEGQGTFEDGAISCSGTQLGMFALLQTNAVARSNYLAAAAYFASIHRCLDQIVVPDARHNGGTLRFWESQYDIITRPNMMCSPHGWSAWNIYSRWYLYQLTGNVEYLRQAMNAMGGCAQVINSADGDLRWAFITDPYVQATIFTNNPANQNPNTQGTYINARIGETYLSMISGWCLAPYATQVSFYSGNDGGCNDNDVHEIFKALEEVALTSAYVVINADDSYETWNCSAVRTNGTLLVTPSESIVSRVHVNAATGSTVSIDFNGQIVTSFVNGFGWQEAPPPTASISPVMMGSSVDGSQLTLYWPQDHIGWRLQMQTSSLGAGLSQTAWQTVPDSSGTNTVTLTIDLTQPATFFRLTYP